MLQARLHASEALQGGALARLEQLEAVLGSAPLFAISDGSIKERSHSPCSQHLSERLSILERAAAERGLLTNGHASCDGEAEFSKRLLVLEHVATQAFEAAEALRKEGEAKDEQFRGSQQLVQELQKHLEVSNAGRAAFADELDRWRREAEALRAEADALRASLGRAELEVREQAASKQAPAPTFEVEAMRCRLKQSVQEASLLRSQLAAREADVTRLERRVRELEGPLGASSKGGISSTALSSSALLCGGSGGSGASGSAAGFGSGGTAMTATALSGMLDEQPSSHPSHPDEFHDDLAAATASSSRTVSRYMSRQGSPEAMRRQVAVPLVAVDIGTPRLEKEAACASTAPAFGNGLPAFGQSFGGSAETVHFAANGNGYGPHSRQAAQAPPMQLSAVQPLSGMRAHPASSTTSPAPLNAAATAGVTVAGGAAGPARARTPPPQHLIRVEVAGFGAQRARSPPRPNPSASSTPGNSESGRVTRLLSAPADAGGAATPPAPPTPHPVSPSDGVPHTMQRSQSVPVQLMHGGGGGNQAPGSGVSLAQWAASPGGPGSSARPVLAGPGVGTPAHTGSPQALSGPPGAQVLGGGLGLAPPPMQMLATGPLGLAARRNS